MGRKLGAEKPFHLRIGINTSYVTVGNFGSEDRMDYTIIGSSVNLTKRLQSYAETDGILLGHETYSLVKDEVDAEEQKPIKVKDSPSRSAATRCSDSMTISSARAPSSARSRTASSFCSICRNAIAPRPSPRSRPSWRG